MTSRNEPAFPVSTSRDVGGELGHQDGAQTWQFPGMTLRDYFAAKAMQGMNANPEILQLVTQSGKPFESHFDRVARMSYEIAEAMLRARGTP